MPNKPLEMDRLYELAEDGSLQPNYELVKAFQMAQGMLSKDAYISLVHKASDILAREPNLVRVDGRVVMFGDIHGQFYDLCEVLRK